MNSQMKVMTTRFGAIDVSSDELLYFKYGILGFEDCHRYVLMKVDGTSPFMYLQSVDDPDLTFVVTPPFWFRPDYQLSLSKDHLGMLGAQKPDQLAVYVIATVPQDPKKITVNLLAPLVINTQNRSGAQIVQTDSPYAIRHNLAEEIERLQQMTKPQKGAQNSAVHEGQLALKTVG